MTDTPTNLPPAGWYPNPQNQSQQRWWDGTAWTEHIQADLVPAPTPAFTPAATPDANASSGVTSAFANFNSTPVTQAAPPRMYNQYNAHEDKRRGKNSFATSALILGILALVLIPFVPFKLIVTLDALAAIVWGILGIRRARDSGIGKGRSVWGLVLGAVALPITLIALVVSSPSFQEGYEDQRNSLQFDKTGVEQQIIDGAAEQGITFTEVDCPEAPTMSEGNEFQCVAKTTDGANMFVDIKVQDTMGNITWQVTE